MSLENNNNNNDNNKNKKTNKKKEKKSFYQTMDKQGFYIILVLCIGIVAATALWVDRQGDDYYIGEGPNNPYEENEQPEVTLVENDAEDVEDAEETQETGKIGEGMPDEAKEDKESSDTENEEVDKESEADKDTDAEDAATKDAEQEDSQQNQEPDKTEQTEGTEETAATADKSEEVSANMSMVLPVSGQITLPFADDKLVYHKTLDQWSTHKGMDIKASEGTPVKAALDGEVVEVINDTIQGITITLKHENDLCTMYSNLSTDAMVEVGKKVTKGETISGVGKTASSKSLEGPLLHFRVLKDDKFVNPEIYIGK